MSALFAPGTMYSNAIKGDVATARVIHGFQVFEQDGTGRESFIDPRNNILCDIVLAERVRAEIIRDAAPELLAALEGLVGLAELRPGHLQDYKSAVLDARAVIAKAKGV